MAKKSGVKQEDVRKWLSKMLYAEQARKDADDRFGYTRALKEYTGDYKSTLPSFMSGVPLVPINEVYGYAKAFIPSVYSRNPHISFNPAGADSVASSKLTEAGVNAYWRELRMRRQVRRAIFDAIFAEGWIKTGFSKGIAASEDEVPLESNEFVRNNEIFSTRVSWQHMVRDTDAVDGLHDARFLGQKIIKPLQAVLDSDIYTAKDIRATHTFDPNAKIGSNKRPGADAEELIEFWEIWDADSQKVLWVSSGCDEYLRDPQPWPYRFNGYPYDLLRFNQLEDECYAPNLIGAWEPQLWEKIKIRSMQMDHVKRFNRQLWAEEGSVDKKELAKFERGQTAGISFYKGKSMPMPSPYPQIQTDIYAIENRIDMDKDNISGQPNAVRGAQQKTQSRTLGEVNSLVGAFQARQVDPQSEVEDLCAEVGLKIAAIMQDYLSGAKLVRVTQEDLPTLIKAYGKERWDGTSFKFTRTDISGAEFEATVECGSTLPLDRQGRVDAMVNILKLGVNIGLTPGDMVSKVIGKNLMTEFEMKEVQLAYEKLIAQMEIAQKLQQAAQRAQLDANDQKIANARAAITARSQQPAQPILPGGAGGLPGGGA